MSAHLQNILSDDLQKKQQAHKSKSNPKKKMIKHIHDVIVVNRPILTQDEINELELMIEWLEDLNVTDITLRYISKTIKDIMNNKFNKKSRSKSRSNLFKKLKRIVGKGLNLAGKAGKAGLHLAGKGLYYGGKAGLHLAGNVGKAVYRGMNTLQNFLYTAPQRMREIVNKTQHVLLRIKNGLDEGLRHPNTRFIKNVIYGFFNQFYEIMNEPLRDTQADYVDVIDAQGNLLYNVETFEKQIKRLKKLIRAIGKVSIVLTKYAVAAKITFYLLKIIEIINIIILCHQKFIEFVYYYTGLLEDIKKVGPNDPLIIRKIYEFIDLYLETLRYVTGPLHERLLKFCVTNVFLIINSLDATGHYIPVLEQYMAEQIPKLPMFKPFNEFTPIFNQVAFGKKSRSTKSYTLQSLNKIIRDLDNMEHTYSYSY